MKSKMAFIAMFLAVSLSTAIAQEQFVFNKDGMSPEYMVVNVDSLNASELYDRTIKWIKQTYVNPDESINTTIENEMVRFTGVESPCLKTTIMGMPFYYSARYSASISFKDNKYKFELKSLEVKSLASGAYQQGYIDLLAVSSDYFKKNGKPRKNFAHHPAELAAMIQKVKDSHENYILTNGKSIQKKDW